MKTAQRQGEPGLAVVQPPPIVTEVMLDLLPIPAALVEEDDSGLILLVVNRAFRRAGLGQGRSDAPILKMLGGRIQAFLTGTFVNDQFPWQFGDAVEGRHYIVNLGRTPAGRCLLTLVDHTGELRTESNLRREMMTDSLTGLPNRAGFSEIVEERTGAGDGGEHHAVLMIDLDRFSRVNACLGSLAGDELLITVARRLKGALRAVDVLARTGGDEFGILLRLEEGPGDADHVARRIHQALAVPFRLSDFEIRVACSIGIAFGSHAISDPEDMIRHAQFALKRAKQTGRTEAYQMQAFVIAREQFSIETELRRAIDGGGLRLTFQPICNLATGEIVSFESLTRWTDERGTEISPVDFIPVAEESGLIVPLGRWAINEAARILAHWDQQAGGILPIRVAVNLSAIQLQRDAIAPIVERALATHGLSGSRFTLELTESALISDPDRVAETMRALKELGSTIAMDDFGTGYSNLAYLQRLPIDVLKIDRSFVTGMLADRDKVSIVRAVLGLAQALGMQTTAEGIETYELAQTLAALGCTYGQGFLYARPLESDDAYALLANRC